MSSPLEQPTDKLAWDHAAEAADDEPRYSLLVVRDGDAATHPLPQSGSLLIGRSAAAEIHVEHGSVSREHARLHLGRRLRLEDLGSSNGTRVRDQRLEPGQPVEVFPDDVIDLGAVLLVVQHRRLTPRLRRATSLAFLQVLVEQECERGERSFAVARVTVEGALHPQVVERLLAAELRAGDLVARSAPNEYRLLLLDVDPDEAARRLEAARAKLAEREVIAGVRFQASPRDGRDPRRILDEGAGKSAARRPLRPEVIAADEAMLRVYRLVERIADSELSVLVLGETGSGKEVIAELVHQLSPRAPRPLVKLNCAAMAESLIDSELFGYQKGAFTGAAADKVGLLESASGGTVFLDEIGDMPANTQVRLLRVLEAREVMPIGAVRARPIDVRIVAATHHDLTEAITAGRFRQDLYYRLNGISVIVPPLRERPLDIEPLARHFLARVWKSEAPLPDFSSAALGWLKTHRWPGNVRELRNVMERAAVLCDGARVELHHLALGEAPASRPDPATATATPDEKKGGGLREEVQELERERILAALARCNGSQRRTAAELGLSRGALIRRLQQLGISPPRRG